MKYFIYKFLAIKFLFCFVFVHWSYSAYVKKVKGKKVLILIEESDEVNKGDIFYLVDKREKKKALIKISKVKNNKALALVRKGKARRGFRLKLKRRKRVSGDYEVSQEDSYGDSQYSEKFQSLKKKKGSEKKSEAFSSVKKSYFGVLGGVNFYNLHAKPGGDLKDSDLVGMGLNGKFFWSLSFLKYLQMPFSVGFKQFAVKTKEKGPCQLEGEVEGEGKSCETLVNYVTGGVEGRLISPRIGDFVDFFLGGGYEAHFPVTKQSVGRYIVEESIKTQGLMFVSAGLNIYIRRNVRVPVSFEYGVFPSAKDKSVTGSYMNVSMGVSF